MENKFYQVSKDFVRASFELLNNESKGLPFISEEEIVINRVSDNVVNTSSKWVRKPDLMFVYRMWDKIKEVHARPVLSKLSKDRLSSGMVVTVEPGIYFEDWGGVRIEDDVLITDDGYEILNKSPKHLIEL